MEVVQLSNARGASRLLLLSSHRCMLFSRRFTNSNIHRGPSGGPYPAVLIVVQNRAQQPFSHMWSTHTGNNLTICLNHDTICSAP